MKKIFINLLLIAGIISFNSCEEDTKTYNGEGGTLVEFSNSIQSLAVEIGSTKEFDIPLNISTSSDSDRTLTLSVVNSETTLETDNYTLNTTVTIPANSFVFNLPITATDVSIEETVKTLVLQIEGFDGVIGNNGKITLEVFQTCPVPDTYATGMYLIEQTSPYVDGPTLSDNTVVEVVYVDALTRSFSTETYPDYCAGSFIDLPFQLRCNKIIVPNTNTICSCGNVTDWFTPATTPDSYDLNDDTVLFVTFTDDTQSDCGTPAQTTYRLTKQ